MAHFDGVNLQLYNVKKALSNCLHELPPIEAIHEVFSQFTMKSYQNLQTQKESNSLTSIRCSRYKTTYKS